LTTSKWLSNKKWLHQ